MTPFRVDPLKLIETLEFFITIRSNSTSDQKYKLV